MPVIKLTHRDDTYTITDPTVGHYVVYGRQGDDTITGNTGNDTLNGNQGNDTLIGGGGNDRLNGGRGDDIIYATGLPGSTTDFTGFTVVHGGEGNDRIDAGTPGQHASGALFGDDGNDAITAKVLHGDYFIAGGSGDDSILTGQTSSTARFVVAGGDGNDFISGVGGTNVFHGGDGNDTLSGAFGTFILAGGDGDDSLSLGSFASGTLYGGDGNDTLTGNAQRDQFVMHGGDGDDHLQGIGNFSAISEQYFGDAGNDTIVSLGGDDLLDGGSGNDNLTGGGGADRLEGGSGNDTLSILRASAADFAVAHGGKGDDLITATSTFQGDNTGGGALWGDAGNDTLTAAVLWGTYSLYGGGGDDVIRTGLTDSHGIFSADGGAGNDAITGAGGVNHFAGGAGNDVLSGSFGDFTLDGGDGDDTLDLGSFATGILNGGNGNDALTGNAQRDTFVMHGGNGDDHLQGLGNTSSLAEQYFGDAGNDTIVAIGGDDLLDGGNGNDDLSGGAGADRLVGGRGTDRLAGGAGNDTIVFDRRAAAGDVVTDFTGNGAAAGDQLLFQGYGTAAQGATFVQLDATHWRINSSDGAVHETLTLANAAAVHASDYTFI